MEREEFEEVVDEALASLPEPFRARFENVDVRVEARPTRAQLRKLGTRRGSTLLGLYVGVPLTERRAGFDPMLPDRIYLFQESLELFCHSREELVREIRKTVVHEVGHYFGLSDDEMEE